MEYFFFEIWISENQIALSEKKPPLAFKNIIVSTLYQSNDKNIDLFGDKTINMPHCFLAITISLLSLTLFPNQATPWKV